MLGYMEVPSLHCTALHCTHHTHASTVTSLVPHHCTARIILADSAKPPSLEGPLERHGCTGESSRRREREVPRGRGQREAQGRDCFRCRAGHAPVRGDGRVERGVQQQRSDPIFRLPAPDERCPRRVPTGHWWINRRGVHPPHGPLPTPLGGASCGVGRAWWVLPHHQQFVYI
jgi:hypothetical protein